MHAWHHTALLPLIGSHTFEYELVLITFDFTASVDRFTSEFFQAVSNIEPSKMRSVLSTFERCIGELNQCPKVFVVRFHWTCEHLLRHVAFKR